MSKIKPIEDWSKTDWENALKQQIIKDSMKTEPKFHFAEVVVVNEQQIGVILKSWDRNSEGNYYYEVYVRSNNAIQEFHQNQITKFIWHKELSEDDLQYYN
jgi:hypothetical protein